MTGSRTADMRSALVDYFREQGRIMIATEAGAEGINLQFCSLVVNYDLPWNPQRIEQRIGRCHRYGQKHDVVVVNFLNRKNAADQRVFQLLSEKFQLFEGVFGASDEVLGAIESGVDFEKRIAAIYQHCRKPEEIQTAFDQLQLELSLEINESMTRTRQQAAGKLRRRGAGETQGPRRGLQGLPQPLRASAHAAHAARAGRPRRVPGRLLVPPERPARFPTARPTFRSAFTNCRAAPARRTFTGSTIRWPKPLIAQAKAASCRRRKSSFDYGEHDGKVTHPGTVDRQVGWLTVWLFTVESLDQAEDHLIFAAVTDEGQVLDEETARRLLTLPGHA